MEHYVVKTLNFNSFLQESYVPVSYWYLRIKLNTCSCNRAQNTATSANATCVCEVNCSNYLHISGFVSILGVFFCIWKVLPAVCMNSFKDLSHAASVLGMLYWNTNCLKPPASLGSRRWISYPAVRAVEFGVTLLLGLVPHVPCGVFRGIMHEI